MERYPAEEEHVLLLLERVLASQRIANMEMRDVEAKKKGKRKKRGAWDEEGDENDDRGRWVGEGNVHRRRLLGGRATRGDRRARAVGGIKIRLDEMVRAARVKTSGEG